MDISSSSGKRFLKTWQGYFPLYVEVEYVKVYYIPIFVPNAKKGDR